jgi:Coenzyme PQQ synthesis protein D (PqqD)
MNRRFKVNSPQTIHQTIEGEVVIINLATGTYYSLRDTGAEIWGLLTSGMSVAEVAQALRERYTVEDGSIEDALDRLTGELVSEGLVVSTNGDGPPPAAAVPPAPEARQPFQAPTLERFDDMQDLILLDPVHEVDEDAGWPYVRPGQQP